MLMEGIVNKFFKKDEKSSGPSLVEQINSQMKLLVEKSGILNDQFESEKNEIASIALEAADLGESKEILAAKLEQDILGRITAVSSACELGLKSQGGGGRLSTRRRLGEQRRTVVPF